jgi:hypothetical protein
MRLFAVGTVNKEGTTWSTVKADSKKEAKGKVEHLGTIVKLTEIKTN